MTTRTIEDIHNEMKANGALTQPAAAPAQPVQPPTLTAAHTQTAQPVQPVAPTVPPAVAPLGSQPPLQPPVQETVTGAGVGMSAEAQQVALQNQAAAIQAAAVQASQQRAAGDTYLPPDAETLPSGVPVRVNEDQPIGLYFEYQKRLVSATGGKTSNVAAALPVNQWLGTRTIELYVNGSWRPINLDDYAGTSSDGLRLKIKDGARLDGLVGKLLETSQDQET